MDWAEATARRDKKCLCLGIGTVNIRGLIVAGSASLTSQGSQTVGCHHDMLHFLPNTFSGHSIIGLSLSDFIVRCNYSLGDHIMNDFFVVIQIQLKFHYVVSSNEVIAMKFSTRHDCVVMACAKFCSDMTPCNGVTLKQIFHQIWIEKKKKVMKWSPACDIVL